MSAVLSDPLPGGEPVTAHNVLMLLASDFVQGVSAPVSTALASVVAANGDPVKSEAAVLTAAGALVGDGTLTLEQALAQLAAVAGYGLSKLDAAVTTPASTTATTAAPPAAKAA